MISIKGSFLEIVWLLPFTLFYCLINAILDFKQYFVEYYKSRNLWD